MIFHPTDHTFVLCAYKKSPYLEDCIRSLETQTLRTNILIATSTPSEYIDRIARAHSLPVFVNPDPGRGIGPDWEFAVSCASTTLVTIAHQDDVYEPAYAETMLSDLSAAKNPILWFCDYQELRNGEKIQDNRNLKIKRLMLFPLRFRVFHGSRFVRRRILSLGCPICCPAVTYVLNGKDSLMFSREMKVSLDWDQWEKQSLKKGSFVYRPRSLFCHRIHENSATTSLIADNSRSREDLEMFSRFWPAWVAKKLANWYSASEKSNALDK